MPAPLKPLIRFDFRSGLRPLEGNALPGRHGDLPPPGNGPDAREGLAFPLGSGGFVLPSKGVIDDQAGSLEIVFKPAGAAPAGALIQAWGQYPPLVELAGRQGLVINTYGSRTRLPVRWRAGRLYRLMLSWDHRQGVTAELTAPGMRAAEVRKAAAWKAFRQTYTPFSLGGLAEGHRLRRWKGAFTGWIRSLAIWQAPLTVPGIALAIVKERQSPAVPAAPGIVVLAVDDPPIRPDPLGLVHLPHRRTDLLKTRRECGLDALLAPCRTELERFTALTSWVAALWPHGPYWPYPKNEQRWLFWKRGHELYPLLRRGEAGGMCGGYAHFMEELFWSLGIDARRVQVKAHSIFEAYLNEQDRWIVCDASFGDQSFLADDGAGRFLNAADLALRLEGAAVRNRSRNVRFRLCRDENLVPSGPLPLHPLFAGGIRFDHVGIGLDKDAELGLRKSRPGKTPFAWYFKPGAAKNQADMGSLGPDHQILTRPDALYPSRNRAVVKLTWASRGTRLRVQAEPFGVTFFEGFLLATDGEPEVKASLPFLWNLHPGVNTLTVRTRNSLGARGYPTRLTLWKQP
jgi:hypothetical protein